jgi:hypothetical protein
MAAMSSRLTVWSPPPVTYGSLPICVTTAAKRGKSRPSRRKRRYSDAGPGSAGVRAGLLLRHFARREVHHVVDYESTVSGALKRQVIHPNGCQRVLLIAGAFDLTPPHKGEHRTDLRQGVLRRLLVVKRAPSGHILPEEIQGITLGSGSITEAAAAMTIEVWDIWCPSGPFTYRPSPAMPDPPVAGRAEGPPQATPRVLPTCKIVCRWHTRFRARETSRAFGTRAKGLTACTRGQRRHRGRYRRQVGRSQGMRLRRNVRVLIAEYNATAPAARSNTALMKLKIAILALKDPATRPSLLIGRADVASAIAMDISMGMLGPGSTLVSRYDDFVWVHHQVMMQGPNDPFGPNFAHRGPAFGPWHRQLLKHYEEELRGAIGDPNLCLPYWDWTKDQSPADLGFPFIADFLGGDGAGNPNDQVATGAFAQASGWNLNVDEEGFGYLRRHFGGDGPGLPTAASVKTALATVPYDSASWNTSSSSGSSFRNVLEGWVGPRQIHNAVHRWVDGSMQPGTSPNDPVFFLHHANIDRLWAIWQQKNAAQAGYLPDNSTAAATGLTRLNDRMATFGRTAVDRYFGVDVTPAAVLNSKAITWYDSDLPELANETGGALAFVNVPEGLTTFGAVRFRITGGRPVHFRITGLPSGRFGLTSMGTEFVASPDDAAPFFFGYVWVQLASVAGVIAPSSMDIHAYLLDGEGYFAAIDGGEYPLGDFHVTLTATSVARANNAVALVLDRSGSMADPAGGPSSKVSLLRNAVGVFNTLMLPTDEIGIVSFDDVVEIPAPIQPVSVGAVGGVLSGPALTPRGLTGIGAGIQQGMTQVALATHTNRSVVVLTDGVENVHPYVGELPPGTLTDRTYAVGFGRPADISTAVLAQITANTHGDLIVTGDITAAEQNFKLTKAFVQILAGVTRMNVLRDPDGVLFIGSEERVPFDVNGADVYLDVIALSPIVELLDFSLVTPGGQIIAGPDANVEVIVAAGVWLYRVVLPSNAADPATSHAGRWTAVFRLISRDQMAGQLRERATANLWRSAELADSLPFSLVVHAYSNLDLNARLHQGAFRPGAIVSLDATLTAYGVPMREESKVWAELSRPDGTDATLTLTDEGGGRFSTSFKTSLTGIYPVRIRAEGTLGGERFTREKTLTAVAYEEEDSGRRRNDSMSEFARCLAQLLSNVSSERLRELGVDGDALKACLSRADGLVEEPRSPRRSKSNAARPGRPRFANAPKSTPIRERAAARSSTMLKPKGSKGQLMKGPRIVRKFSLPDERAATTSAKQTDSDAGGFPRRVHRFSRADDEALMPDSVDKD